MVGQPEDRDPGQRDGVEDPEVAQPGGSAAERGHRAGADASSERPRSVEHAQPDGSPERKLVGRQIEVDPRRTAGHRDGGLAEDGAEDPGSPRHVFQGRRQRRAPTRRRGGRAKARQPPQDRRRQEEGPRVDKDRHCGPHQPGEQAAEGDAGGEDHAPTHGHQGVGVVELVGLHELGQRRAAGREEERADRYPDDEQDLQPQHLAPDRRDGHGERQGGADGVGHQQDRASIEPIRHAPGEG